MGFRRIGLVTLAEHHVLGFLAEDLDLCERLAQELEIETDPGDSAGAFLQDTCQRLRHEDRLNQAERRVEELRRGRRP